MISMFSDFMSYRVQEARDLLMGKGLTSFGDSSHKLMKIKYVIIFIIVFKTKLATKLIVVLDYNLTE